MFKKEDIELIERVTLKTQRKLTDTIVGNSPLCEHLDKLTRKEIQTIFIIGNKNSKTMGEIAENLGVNISTPIPTIDRLIKKKYVLREVGERDRRQVWIRLTKDGLELYEQLSAIKLKKMKIVLEVLSEKEVDLFRTILEKLDREL